MPVSDKSLNVSVKDLEPLFSFAHFEAIRILPSFRQYIEKLLENKMDAKNASAAVVVSLLLHKDPMHTQDTSVAPHFSTFLSECIHDFVNFQARFSTAFSIYHSLKTCIVHEMNLSAASSSTTSSPSSTYHDPSMRKVTLCEMYYGAMETDIKACEYYQITLRSFR